MLPGVNVYKRSGPYHIELIVDICTICAVAIPFLYNYYVDLVCFCMVHRQVIMFL